MATIERPALVGAKCQSAELLARHTTFRYCLDPTVEQQMELVKHAGASRFAFNECLRTVKAALIQRKADPTMDVPWTGFDLINIFNAWKKTEAAGRKFVVNTAGTTDIATAQGPRRRVGATTPFGEIVIPQAERIQ